MKTDWPDNRCIICLGTPRPEQPKSERTDAHVIPDSVGGKLSAPFLCKGCNSDMGVLEAKLPKDAMVLGLVDRLYDVLPADLAAGIYRHAGYFADSEDFGRIYSRMRTGTLIPTESDTIRSDRNTLRQIEAELRRADADDATINAKLIEFTEAQDGARIGVGPLSITKGIPMADLDWQRTWSEPVVSNTIPLGIAYLYLALSLRGRIYDDRLEEPRRALRLAIAGEREAADGWPCELLRSEKPPEPKHALVVVNQGGDALVTIWLFRELVWRVPFPGVRVDDQPFYLLDLVTGVETIT